MERIVNYLKNVYTELVEKTSWPSWSDLFNSARVVMVASLIIALIVWVMDFAFEHVLKMVYDVL
ncbi:MAG: preprotein translocase subunit SecE [Bacteroidales bacterium]|jgi:preprotein translocase subunit SecE|nr:preprotein translocase subunit SecE [Bacteroidales bacterium]